MTEVRPLGLIIKENHISLDVVNFSVSEEAFPQSADEYEEYKDAREEEKDYPFNEDFPYSASDYEPKYARKELAVLVTVVNDKGHGQLVDVDVDKSSVSDFLSKSILKKNLKYLRRKAERKAKRNVNLKQKLGRNEKNKSAAEYGKELPPSELIDTEDSHSIDAICNTLYFALSSWADHFHMHDERSGKLTRSGTY